MADDSQVGIPPPAARTPPAAKMTDYPGVVALSLGVFLTTILVVVAGKLDPTHGVLTISLVVVLAFIGVIVVSVLWTIPTDETTSAVIGGLVAAFGAIVTYWIGRGKKD
jgi:hypothetical protein